MKKKIFLFIDNLGPGGAQRQFVGLARLLSQKGYDVKTATYYDIPFYKPLLDETGIPYECFNIDSKLALPRLVKSMKLFETDVLISFQTIPNSIACFAAKLAGTKLIVSERNTHQSVPLREKLIFQLYRMADYVVPNSHSEGKFVNEHFPFLKDKVVTITNFVDLNKFHPAKQKPKNRRITILTAASIRESKNTKRYIEACIKAINQGCDVDIVWYGINDRATEIPEYVRYTDECVEMVRRNGMEGRIRLLPKRKNIEEAYHEADIFCLPSHFEGTPNVICEAMASGLPVMASNVCDNPNFVFPRKNGWLFNEMDINDMCATICAVTTADSGTLYNYGLESRNIVEDKCSEEVFVSKYIKLIESL